MRSIVAEHSPAATASEKRAIFPVNAKWRFRGDLDNIVLKAIRKEPERRYASAEQLAEDIRRYLEGLPVSAVPDSLMYRGNKFVRRHKLGFATTVLLVMTVAAGVLATIHQAHRATVNQLRAERRFADVRKLANSLLFEINDSIQDLPGSVPARKLLVEKALEYLDSLSHESGSDPSLQRELASAYKRVGDVQGYPFLANLGDVPGALRSYRKALEIESTLVRTDPNNVPDALDLATVYRRLSELDSMNHDLVSALEEGRQAVTLGEQLSAKFPQDRKVMEGLLKDYQTLAGIEGGNASANFGDTSSALSLHRKVVGIAERLVIAEPNNKSLQRLLASGVLRLGDQLVEAGDRAEALQQYQRGKEILATLASPNNAVSQADLAESYARLGDVQLTSGELVAALEDFRKGLKIYMALSKADPSDTNVREGLALAYMNSGDAEFKMGRGAESLSDLRMARTTVDELASKSPTTEIRSDQALVHVVQGEALDKIDRAEEASHHFQSALAIYTTLTEEDSNDVDNRLCLAATFDKLGEALLHQKKLKEAENAFRAAMKLVQTQGNPNDSNAQLLYVLADSYTGLGDVVTLRGENQGDPLPVQIENLQAALSFYEQSIKAWKKVRQPGIESPDGFDSIPPAAVVQRIKRCGERLRQLHAMRETDN